MKPGETLLFSCSHCSTDFEITLEPNLAGATGRMIVELCPFCGCGLNEKEEDVPVVRGKEGENS